MSSIIKTQFVSVFKRYEKKYLMNTEQYNSFIKKISKYMKLDDYGKHTICNIYLDTINYEMISASIKKPMYKEKLRLRSYGIPTKNDNVFLELKKKFNGIVYKRRISLPLHVANNYIFKGIYPKEYDCQILRELDYSIKYYNAIPKVNVSYQRMAYFGIDNSNLRLTIDQNILCRNENINLELPLYGNSILGPNKYLMEIKIPETMPIWLSYILSELSIYPISFSKYGCFFENNLCNNYNKKQDTKGEFHYA